jgi:hypothetical protein
MSGMADFKRDPDLEWLDHVQPVGLVVAPIVLKELGLAPSRQTQADTAVIAEHINADSTKPALGEAWPLFAKVLGWKSEHVDGSPGGPDLSNDLYVKLPEHNTTLSPTWAVRELEAGDQRWQLLVRVEASGIDPDARGAADGWEATPHQRFERLLRETGVFAGLLVSEKKQAQDGEDRYSPELRLIYAPRGETSGHLTFPLRELGTVAGRPMLGGLKLLLDSFRLFADASDRRLPTLLKKSRDAQAAVSTALADQVLGALHELLRGLYAAEPELIRELARSRPDHLYEGLLTVLMRLVFILYAEDRDLLPSRTDGRTRQIYETSYFGSRPLCPAQRGCRAQSRYHGRAPRRLGAVARAVSAHSQGPSQPFRPGPRRQAVRSGSVSVPRRTRRPRRSTARARRLRRLPATHPRRPNDAAGERWRT